MPKDKKPFEVIDGGSRDCGELPVPLGPPPESVTDRGEVEEFFHAEMKRLGVQYDYATESYRLLDPNTGEISEPTSQKLLTTRLYRNGMLKISDMPRGKDAIADYLYMWTADQERTTIENVRNRVRTVDIERGEKELKKWISIVCREGHELTEVMLKQWIWQVRVKLFTSWHGDNHVLPVLCGKQGAGKTKAIRSLINYLNPLTSYWTFSQIVDDRHWFGLQRTYIGYIEELAGGRSEKEFEELKGIISGDYRTLRVMQTNSRTSVKVNITFIGDTNRSIPEIIKDRTGARRYWEIRCRNRIDLDALETVDIGAIWGCVDEKGESPYWVSPLRPEIDRIRAEKLVTPTNLSLWLRDRGYEPAPPLREFEVTVDTLYDDFKAFCKENNSYVDLTKDKWGKAMLKEHGFDSGVVKRNKRSVRVRYIREKV
jgi:uncharacterized protein with HEPN domain